LVDPAAAPTIVHVIALGENFLEKETRDVLELDSITATYQRVWIDVVGLGSEATLRDAPFRRTTARPLNSSDPSRRPAGSSSPSRIP
jgi:hypothetical protein